MKMINFKYARIYLGSLCPIIYKSVNSYLNEVYKWFHTTSFIHVITFCLEWQAFNVCLSEQNIIYEPAV